MKKVLVVSSNMVSHLYATAKLARILNAEDGYTVDYGCPDHDPSIQLVATLLPERVNVVTLGVSLTKKQMNERVVTDPLSWQTLWNALLKPFPLAEGVNDLFDQQVEMYAPIKDLIRAGGYDCVVTIHSTCQTVCDAVESLKIEGEAVPPCIMLNSLPYDAAIYKGEWECWKEPRTLTAFPHVSFYPTKPSSICSLISMRLWQAWDTFLTWRAWNKSEARCNELRQKRGLPPVKGNFLYYVRNFPVLSFGGTAPFGDYDSIPTNVTCIGSLDAPEQTESKISDSLQSWLDDAGEEGVIYAGFGTGTILNEKEARAFTGSLSLRLTSTSDDSMSGPRILWALRSSEISRLEAAITDSIREEPTLRTEACLQYGTKLRIESDLPQKSLLQSPQVKLFISHMGMGGFVEGVAAKVPFLCYPTGCDQYYNTRRAIEAGIAERITDLNEIPKQVFKILNNDGIKQNSETAAQALLKTHGNERALGSIEELITQYRSHSKQSLRELASSASTSGVKQFSTSIKSCSALEKVTNSNLPLRILHG